MYLTFDDGPVYGTENILEVISEEQVPAAMFFIGKHILGSQKNQKNYELAKNNPYVLIGNHTHSHAKGKYRSFYSQDPSIVVSDISKTHEILTQDGLTNNIPYTRLAGRNVFRLPSIEKNDIFISKKQSEIEVTQYDAVWNSGFYLYGWDYEWEFDYRKKQPARTVDQLISIIERLYRTNKTVKKEKFILLMHDQMFKDRYNGKENLKALIQKLRAKGWEFDSLTNYLTHNDFLYATNMPKNKATPLQKLANNELKLPKPQKVVTASIKAPIKEVVINNELKNISKKIEEKIEHITPQSHRSLVASNIIDVKSNLIDLIEEESLTKIMIESHNNHISANNIDIAFISENNKETKIMVAKHSIIAQSTIIDKTQIKKEDNTKTIVAKHSTIAKADMIDKTPMLKVVKQSKMPMTKKELKKELFDAIKRTDARKMLKVLKLGADVYSYNEYGQSPLVLATSMKKSSIVQILINHGADINHKDKNGDSAISVLQKMTQ